MKKVTRGWFLGLFVVLFWGCGPTVAPARLPDVEYFERTAAGYEITKLYSDDGCGLTRHKGPTLEDLAQEDFVCTAAELEAAEMLLSDEAWATYVGIISDGFGGAGGESSVDPGEKQPLTEDTDLPPSVDRPVGYVRVDRTWGPSGNLEIKVFNADSTGPEAALIDYFQALNKKYVPKKN